MAVMGIKAAVRTKAPGPAHRSGSAVARCSKPAPEFPGCTPVRLTHEETETFEGRLEYWDGATATAWVSEPTSPYHEEPSETLSELLALIAGVRGSPIKRYGSMDLLVREAGGRKRAILQADQSVYLHPGRAVLPGASAMEVGVHDFPDVVLEVDHTTDMRRGKLGLYQAWGFPEIWVEVPDKRARSRARRRAAGLTIHLRSAEGYRESDRSRAFPGWTAAEIHAAMNEPVVSARTCAVLERVGAALGAQEGTGPDDAPLFRSQRRQGFERGFERGRTAGLLEARAELAREMLASRGIAVSVDFPAGVPGFTDLPAHRIAHAAAVCTSEADFHKRLRRGE